MEILLIDTLSQVMNLSILGPTMQVLYQEIISAHESKHRASEMNLSKSTARLP